MLIRSVFLFFCLIFAMNSYSQKKINQYKNGRKQGLWIAYNDSTKTGIYSTGRYRKGYSKGIWKYYHENGKLKKHERTIFRTMYTRLYHPNGKLYKKGKAKIIQNDELIHYYYYGPWKVYTNNGKLHLIQEFNEGKCISEKLINDPDTLAKDDSLVNVIRNLSERFNSISDSLHHAETFFPKGSAEYNKFIKAGNAGIMQVYSEIDKIILKHGYPGKSQTGQEYSIVFSMLSNGTFPIKVKYYDLIIAAADAGELDWIDVAFYVDKIKVGKKEKQIYGTQYYLDEKLLQLRYYPIENKEELNERRKKVGLWKVDVSEMIELSSY
ncbi:MAG: hypothetical protein M3R27_00215 [Bacteroidota bacterium]|nr:hypothetical protein [Bacteroidota bacterium]